jgi:predicted transposase YdaD
MIEIKNPHDLFLKYLLSRKEVAADFIANYAPESARLALDLDSLELSKDSFSQKVALA